MRQWHLPCKSLLPPQSLLCSAKGYLLCAGICQLASNSLPGVRDAIQRYNDIDITFENSREEGLLTALADALEARDADAFTAAVQEFDSMTRLDAWKTAILVRGAGVQEHKSEVKGGASRGG